MTPYELSLVIAALDAVSPSGGGSSTHTLAMKLAKEAQFDRTTDDHLKLVCLFIRRCADECVEDRLSDVYNSSLDS